ncbi:MAG: phage tail protein [Fimbriimonadaceae bacterium]|nr:phage tail protein [Fimbriimonadaceae bacterium]QYK58002.1 MAG: phage tail protein [Fimbriimonadaceae bacterium]
MVDTVGDVGGGDAVCDVLVALAPIGVAAEVAALMATLVLGGLGAVVGSAFGPAGARWGWAVGSLVGSWIDQQSVPGAELGKLSDLRYSGSSYGSPLPRVWGRARVGCQVVWAHEVDGNHLVERSRTSGRGGGGSGGGGGRVTTYWYTSTFAAAVCSGAATMPDGGTVDRGLELKRLWADDELVYDSAASSNAVEPVWHDGGESQPPDATMVSLLGLPSGSVEAYRGLAYFVLTDMDLERYGNRIPNLVAEVGTEPVTVGDVFSDLCRSAGIPPGLIDVAGATEVVSGYVVSGRSSVQESLQPLLTTYGYDAVEVDGAIRLVKRGGSVMAYLSQDETGAGLDGEFRGHVRKRLMETEVPSRVEVRYWDLDSDFAQSSQSAVRQTAGVQESRSIDLPMALTASQARAVAARELDRSWVELETVEGLSLLPRWLRLAPGDVVKIAGGFRGRVVRMAVLPWGPVEVDLVADDSAVVVQDPPGGGGGGGGGGLTVVPTTFVVWSGKELLDEHQYSAGFYVAATGGAGWRGCAVWYSLDDGSTWSIGPSIGAKSVFGETETALGSSGAVAGQFDDTNTVDVDLSESNGFAASVADAQVHAGENVFVVGYEVLGVADASLLGPHRYTFSRLKRGLRKSPMTGHAAGELVVLASPSVGRVQVADSFVGETVFVKCVSPGQSLAEATSKAVVIAARTPTSGEQALASVVVPQFLGSPATVQSSTTAAVDWTTFDAAGHCPDGSTVAILEAVGQGQGPDDLGVFPQVEGRKDGLAPALVLLRARMAGSGDAPAYGQQAFVPMTESRTFQYRILEGFEEGCSIRLIGFFGPP